MSPDSPSTNELFVKLQRNINLMQTAIDNEYFTDKIRTIGECKDIINKRKNLIFKSLACFIVNSPSTLDLFDNNTDKLEESLKVMLSSYKAYNSAVQTDRTS